MLPNLGSNDVNTPFNSSFIHVSSKVIDIPGDGYISSFQCILNNPNVPAWYGVLRPVNDSTTSHFEVVCSEFSSGFPSVYFWLDRVLLSEPCKVQKGDYLAYAGPAGEQRCRQDKLNKRGFLLEMNFTNDSSLASNVNQVLDGFVFVNTSQRWKRNVTTPAFTAIFDCGCEDPLIGGVLAYHGYEETDVEDVIFYSSEIIPPQTSISGIAVYTENPDDDTVIISVVAANRPTPLQFTPEDGQLYQGPPECVLCQVIRPNGSKIGVEEHFFEDGPCLVDTYARIKIWTHSRTENKNKNRIGHQSGPNAAYRPFYLDQEMNYSMQLDGFPPRLDCELEINGRVQEECNRSYSVAAIRHCSSSVPRSDDPWPSLQDLITIALPPSMEGTCPYDYTDERIFGGDLEAYNSESLTGPAVYVDMQHPLSDGIVTAWNLIINDFKMDSSVYPTVWRQSESDPSEFHIICQGYLNHTDDIPIATVFTRNDCFVQKGDFLGFVYTGHGQIPLAHVEVTEDEENFLTLLDPSKLETVLPPVESARYNLANAHQGYKFSIGVRLCTVNIDPTLTLNTDYDSWREYEEDLGGIVISEIYDRQKVSFESELIVDMLNIIPFDGFITSFGARIHNCGDQYGPDDTPIMMMLRPVSESKFEVVCSVQLPPCPGNGSDFVTIELQEECSVERGDVLGVALGNEETQTIAYDNVENYPSYFLNQLYEIKESKTCERKYTMGFIFKSVFHPEVYGSHLIDRPDMLFDESTSNTKIFTYVDKTSMLGNGILGSYEVMLNEAVSQITFFVQNMSGHWQESCELVKQGSQVQIGVEQSFSLESAACEIGEGMMIGMEVMSDSNTFDYTCDETFHSQLDVTQGTLTNNAEACAANGNVRLSFRARTREVYEGFDYSRHHNYDEELHGSSNNADQCHECAMSPVPESDSVECNTFPKRFGTLTNFPNHEEWMSMMFVDTENPLHAGVLTQWAIVVGNPASQLVSAVWRPLGGDQYQLVCKGYATSGMTERNSVERILPTEMCVVEDGDMLGFVSMIGDDQQSPRIRGETGVPGHNYKYSTYPDFKKTKFRTGGIYALRMHGPAEDLLYPIEASICPHGGGNEACTYGRVLTPESSQLEESTSEPDETLYGTPVVYIDNRKPVVVGTLFSWSYVLDKPNGNVYPVIWRKTGNHSYEIACYSYDSETMLQPGSVREVKPFGKCEIDSQDYYVGLVSYSYNNRVEYHLNETAGTKAVLGYPEVRVDFGQTFYSQEMSMSNPLWNQYPDSRDMVEVYSDMIFKIDVQVCQDKNACTGSLTVDLQSSSSITLDRIVLYEQREYSACLSKLHINAIRPGNAFNISLWERVNSNGMRFKLLKTKMLTTATFGEETFDIEDFCAETGDYFGFTFYNRRIPFYSSRDDLLDIQFSSVITTERYIDGAIVEFSNEPPIGKMPVKLCWLHDQIIGNYYPSSTNDEELISLFKQSTDGDSLLMSILSETETVSDIDAVSHIEFTAKVAKPGLITFMFVSEVNEFEYEIVKSYTFSAQGEGAQIFKVDGDVQLDSGLKLAVAAEKDILLYQLIDDPAASMVSSALVDAAQVEQIGQIVQSQETDKMPAVGVRIALDLDNNL